MPRAHRQTRASRPGASDDAAIRARGVTHRYGDVAAVQDVDLDLPRGRIFGFIGPSGAGKTTTIRILTGILTPTGGEVRVLGGDPTMFSPRQRTRIGYMPQLSVLFPTLSLAENLNFVGSLYGLVRRRGRIRRALEFVELDGDRNKRLQDSSGGMQRRLALAAALVHDPELVFLDEPTAGIDPVLRRKMWEHFAELRDNGRTLFITTQYVGEAAYCDLVGVLSGGELVAVDTPEGLRERVFGGDMLDVRLLRPATSDVLDELRSVDGVRDVSPLDRDGAHLRVTVNRADRAVPRLTDWFDRRHIPVESIREHSAPFDDVFVALMQDRGR